MLKIAEYNTITGEKVDRGIITPQEWQLIYDNFKEYLD